MIGTNSLIGSDAAGKPETVAQYIAKYDSYLATIRAAAPTKPILCITPILNRADLKPSGNQNGERPNAYRDGIAGVVRRRQKADVNLYLLDGLTMINDSLYLLVTDNMSRRRRAASPASPPFKTIMDQLMIRIGRPDV
jgi:hypothetical protein